jgi:hypothetical protein
MMSMSTASVHASCQASHIENGVCGDPEILGPPRTWTWPPHTISIQYLNPRIETEIRWRLISKHTRVRSGAVTTVELVMILPASADMSLCDSIISVAYVRNLINFLFETLSGYTITIAAQRHWMISCTLSRRTHIQDTA